MNSPHVYRDVLFSVKRHNEGRKLRVVFLNREVQVVLLDYTLDFLSIDHIQKCISSFDRLLHQEVDARIIGRVMIYDRVFDLALVPQFIVISEGDTPQGKSWIVQCEIIQSELISLVPQDEYHIPKILADGIVAFNFFGLVQPVVGPQFQPNDA